MPRRNLHSRQEAILKRLSSLIVALGLLLAACGSPGDNQHTGGAHMGSAPTATRGAGRSGMPGMSGAATPSSEHSGMPGMGGEGTAITGMSFDQMFIAAMIPHHQSATEMAKIARKKGEHREIRQLAGEIISAQQREIDQMRAWYKQWYGTDEVPEMNNDMMGRMMPGMDMRDMGMEAQDLSDAKPFDKAFIDAMIPHHESAVMMAEHALEQAKRPEIKQLAREIISAQREEIGQMERWRKAWYGS